MAIAADQNDEDLGDHKNAANVRGVLMSVTRKPQLLVGRSLTDVQHLTGMGQRAL